MIAAVMLAGAVVHLATPAWACSCASLSLEDQIDESDAIFSGEVIHVQDGARNSPMRTRLQVGVAVDRVWKGEVAEQATVHTPSDGPACGYSFAVEQSYLIFAHEGEQGQLETNLCRRNAPVQEATDDLAALDAGYGQEPLTGAGQPDSVQPPAGSRARPRPEQSAAPLDGERADDDAEQASAGDPGPASEASDRPPLVTVGVGALLLGLAAIGVGRWRRRT